ncbi:MAG TPA: CHASE3 domain-containing protein, partial [Kofleriaceae bacterium]|nr:CHASE3 domain-containing protein [Kofleriaceae bacterium]
MVAERVPQRRWLVLLAMLLIGLLVAGVFSLWSLANASRWTEHSSRVRLAVAQLLKSVTDAETGARGYVVAGEPAFLDVYETSAVAWKAELDDLRMLVADNSAQQQRVDRLGKVIGARFELLSNLRSRFNSGARGTALTSVMLDGKRVMDEARGYFSEIESEEVRLDE